MKYLYICILSSLLLCVGCGSNNENKENKDTADEKQTAAEEVEKSEPTWDYFIIGSWNYGEVKNEQGESSDYPNGIESFSGDGTYKCMTVNKDGEDAILDGKWTVDEKEDFTINIHLTGVTVNDEKKEVDETLKYTILSLEPESFVNYQVGDNMRRAMWLKEK